MFPRFFGLAGEESRSQSTRWHSGLLSCGLAGLVNTVAGVGGPPLSTHLIGRIEAVEDYLKTQQVLFFTLNVASLPFVGVATSGPVDAAAAVGVLFLGRRADKWCACQVVASDDAACCVRCDRRRGDSGLLRSVICGRLDVRGGDQAVAWQPAVLGT
jgi:hypothetical protein